MIASIRSLLLALLVLAGILAPATALASPAGLWRVEGFGFTLDFHVETTVINGRNPLLGVVRPSQAGGACPLPSSFQLERLCEKAEKDGPFAVWGTARPVRTGDGYGQYALAIEHAGGEGPVPFDLVRFDDQGRIAHEGRSGRDANSAAISVSSAAILLDVGPEADAAWADGYWVADFGNLRVEAALAAGGSTALDGIVAFHAVNAPGLGLPGTRLSNFHRVAEDFFSFAMLLDAGYAGYALDFTGDMRTGPEYTEINQSGEIVMRPFAGVGIVARVRNLDNRTWSDPFLFSPFAGPLTPLPPRGDTVAQATSATSAAPPSADGPSGLWVLEGASLAYDLVIEPLNDGGVYPAYLVIAEAQDGNTVCSGEGLAGFGDLCDRVEKGGPLVLWGDLTPLARPTVGEIAYQGLFSSQWTGANGLSVNMMMSPGAATAMFSNAWRTGDHQGRRLAPVAARLVEEKFTPDSGLANGQWLADFDGLSIELDLSASGPAGLVGTIQALAPQQVNGFPVPSAVLGDWIKTLEEQGPFETNLSVQLPQTGSFFAGPVTAGDGSGATLELLPVSSRAIVAVLGDGQEGLSEPFALMPLDRPLASLPASGTGDGGMGQTGDEGIAGVWQARHMGLMLDGRMQPSTVELPASVTIASSASSHEMTVALPGPTYGPITIAPGAFGDTALSIIDRFGPIDGQNARQWLGGDPQAFGGMYESGVSGVGLWEFTLLVNGNRAILLTGAGADPDPLTVTMMALTPRSGRVLLLKRAAANGDVVSVQPGGATGPSAAGATQSHAASPAGASGAAAALVQAADVSRACATLMALEVALWSGAADGTVALTDLRTLAQIMYAHGVRNAGMSNEDECRNILIIMQAAI